MGSRTLAILLPSPGRFAGSVRKMGSKDEERFAIPVELRSSLLDDRDVLLCGGHLISAKCKSVSENLELRQ